MKAPYSTSDGTGSLLSKGQAFREIIEHNGAVAIVPITDDGNVVMVEQYRYACGQTVLEIPAGKIDKERRIRRRWLPGS